MKVKFLILFVSFLLIFPSAALLADKEGPFLLSLVQAKYIELGEKENTGIPEKARNSIGIKDVQFIFPITASSPFIPNSPSNTIYAEANDASTTGVDINDIPSPPSPPEPPYFSIRFMVGVNSLMKDSRPLTGSPASATWDFRVKPVYDDSGITAVPVTLTWNLSSVSTAYWIAIQDQTTSTTTFLWATPGYIYTGVDSMFRNFKLFARVNQQPMINIIYPNGGETIMGTATITATASDPDSMAPYNDISSVKFYYSISPWTSWNFIGNGTLSGTSTWTASWNTIPLPVVSGYKIKAVATDSLGLTAEDTSDASFSVSHGLWYATITGTLATASDTFSFGQAYLALAGVDSYDIPNPPPPPEPPYPDLYSLIGSAKYFRDIRPISNQAIYNFKVKAEGISGNTSLAWNIAPVPLTFDYLILQDASSGYLTNMKAISNYSYNSGLNETRDFNIYLKTNSHPSVQVTYPNGGEVVGGPATISAVISDVEGLAPYNDTISAVNFYYSTSPWTTWTLIGPGSLASGSYASGLWQALWNTLVLTEGSGYKIRAVATDGKGAYAEDISDAGFNISTILWGVDITGSLSSISSQPGAKALYSDSITAGIAPWASTGSDGYDIPNPPTQPNPPYLDMYFMIGTEKFTRDARPHADPTTWNFKVNAAGISGPTTLSRSLVGRAPGQDHIILEDLFSGIKVNLSIMPSYTYNSSLDEVRNFNLSIRTNQPPQAQMVYPNGGETTAWVFNVIANITEPDALAPFDDNISAVAFQYSTNGLTWSNTGPGVKTGTSTWSAPWNARSLANGANYKARVIATDSLGLTGMDISDSDFIIKANLAPSVQVVYPNGGETVGGMVNVSAMITDPDEIAPYNDFVAQATFQYSTNGLTWNNIGLGVMTGTSTWSVSWNTTVLPEGSTYKIRVNATDSLGLASSDTSNANFTVIHKILVSRNFPAGWNMWSYPLYPNPASNSWQLGDDIANGLYVFHYNTSSGNYDLTDTATAGWGYWTKVNASVMVDAEGFPVSVAEYEMPVGNGWNQVGNPFNGNVSWNNVKVKKDGVIKTMTQAHAEGWLYQWLYSYNPVTSQYITKGAADGVLQAFVGYWVKVNQPGVALLIPSP